MWFNSFRMPDWVHGSLLHAANDPLITGKKEEPSLRDKAKAFFSSAVKSVTQSGDAAEGRLARALVKGEGAEGGVPPD